MDTKSQVQVAVQLANGEFIKGFIAGQFILAILIFFLLKVFLLRNSTETVESLSQTKSFILPKVFRIDKIRSMTVQQKHAIDSVILTKLEYDTSTHPNESCDWINVFFAQFISTLRNDSTILIGLADKISVSMNRENTSSFVGPISITDFHLGEEFPEFKNARVRFSDLDGNMRILLDFSFDDQITIALDTQALVNWPKPAMASLPISLSFTLIVLEFLCQTTDAQPNTIQETEISVFIMDDFILDFGIGSLLGHRTKIKDLPKLTSLLKTMLRNVFVKQLVYPSRKVWRIPKGSELL